MDDLLERCLQVLEQLEYIDDSDRGKVCPICEGEYNRKERMVYHESGCELEEVIAELRESIE